jgi:hypothetical protein
MATEPDLGAIREHLGQHVRAVWITWAAEQPNPKPSWLVPWEALSEADREVDRRIGEALYQQGYGQGYDAQAARLAAVEQALLDWQDHLLRVHRVACDYPLRTDRGVSESPR